MAIPTAHSCDGWCGGLPWPVSYGTVTPMESEPGSSASDAAEESDSERRRRRRRRRKKKGKQASVETQRLLLLARWAVGALTMFAAWGCGIYVYATIGSVWGALIYFPAGIAAMICVSYALAVPFVAMLAMIVGFLSRINSGPSSASSARAWHSPPSAPSMVSGGSSSSS